jgi:hypothetical protein
MRLRNVLGVRSPRAHVEDTNWRIFIPFKTIPILRKIVQTKNVYYDCIKNVTFIRFFRMVSCD